MCGSKRIKTTADNSGHTATVLCTFAQIQPYSWTSYVRKLLGERIDRRYSVWASKQSLIGH